VVGSAGWDEEVGDKQECRIPGRGIGFESWEHKIFEDWNEGDCG
jgi:hypothetical protein